MAAIGPFLELQSVSTSVALLRQAIRLMTTALAACTLAHISKCTSICAQYISATKTLSLALMKAKIVRRPLDMSVDLNISNLNMTMWTKR